MTAERVIAALAHTEATEGVRVLYAVESGSRAWGFPSRDSDYDARFLYVRPIADYLTIDERRDVIEQPITDDLDVNGWDLRKALVLFRKTNAGLLEWLHSTPIYAEPFVTAERLRTLEASYFNPRACMYHYLQLARGNFRDLQGERARIKTYLYVLRSVLACRWIERYQSVPPVDFLDQLDVLPENAADLITVIREVVQRKMQGEATEMPSPIPVLHQFLAEQITYFEGAARVISVGAESPGNIPLDDLFRATLHEVWGGW